MGAAEALGLGGLAEHVVDLGQRIDVVVHAVMFEHRQDAFAALDFAKVMHIGQVAAEVVATHPGQAVLAYGLLGRHRLADQPQGVDVVHVEVPARVQVVVVLVLVRAYPGVSLATLDQPDRTAVRRALGHHLDPGRLEHLAQHVPGHPGSVGVGVVEPLFADQVDLLRHTFGSRRPRGKAQQHCQQHRPHGHSHAPCIRQPPTPEPACPARQTRRPGYRRA
ncbi:hypothetical protein D3C75_914020 [compost metagenome]